MASVSLYGEELRELLGRSIMRRKVENEGLRKRHKSWRDGGGAHSSNEIRVWQACEPLQGHHLQPETVTDWSLLRPTSKKNHRS